MVYNVGFEVCAAIMLAVFTAFVRICNPLKKPQNVSYLNLSLSIIVTCVSDIIAAALINAVSVGYNVPMLLLYGSNVFYFVMSAFSCFYYCIYLLNFICGNGKTRRRALMLLSVPCSMFTVFALLTPVTHLLFYFNENGNYLYGSMHYMAAVVLGFYILINPILLVYNIKKLDLTQFVSAMVFNIAVAAGTLIQNLITPNVCIGFAVAAMAIIVLYFSLETPDSYALMKALKELKAAKEKEEAASKAKEEFLAHISHEIRTPINSMLGMSEMIIRTSSKEEVINYAKTAQNSGRQLLDMVNDVLDYTKLNSGGVEIICKKYSTAELFRSIYNDANAMLNGKNVEFVTAVDEKIPAALEGDAVRIKQSADNLISNAVKYTDEGKITLSAAFDPSQGTLKISVADTGCGIKEEDLSRIFDSFVRIDSEKNLVTEGAGLGLSVVSKLIGLMDGKVNVESRYGEGSTFSFEIPQDIVDSIPVGKIDFEKDDDIIGKLKSFIAPSAKVLVTDDSEVNLFVMKEMLKQFGICADAAGSGSLCVEMASEKKYDIIFLDHMMPELDGIQAMHLIKGSEKCLSRDSAIIVLTANAVVGAREQYLSEGFNDYMSKPVMYDDTAAALLKYLPRHMIIPKKDDASHKSTEDIFLNIDLSHIDTSIGMESCHGKPDVYIKLLTVYADQAADYAKQLEDSIADKKLDAYAVAAHAVKSSSASIGAMDISDVAGLQEMFAKQGSYGDIISMHSDFIKALIEVTAEARKICIRIQGEQPEVKVDDRLYEISREEYLDVLDSAAEKLSYYDEEGSVRELARLDNAKYKDEPCVYAAEEARRKIDAFDMDGAKEVIAKVIESLGA